jgi:hypothetical protein
VIRPLVLLALLAAAAPADAWPVLGEGRATPGGYCYPDHELQRVWWVAPTTVGVKEVNGLPAIELTSYRYQGSRATDDSSRFFGGTLLQFSLAFESMADRLEAARRSLGGGAEVRPLAPATVEAEVVFAGIDPVARQAVAGEPGLSGPAAWQERSFSLGLSPEETEAVRRAWDDGAVILSVNVTASALAYHARPAAEIDPAPEPELLPVLVDAVPVTVDRQRQPGAIRVLELDATMPAGYTALDLGCAELSSAGGFTDLARVLVDVEATAVNGDRIRQQLRFDEGSPPVQNLRFDRAVRLDEGYRLRVLRTFASGATETAVDRRIEVWQGFVDVCSRPADKAEVLDPRLLY